MNVSFKDDQPLFMSWRVGVIEFRIKTLKAFVLTADDCDDESACSSSSSLRVVVL